MFKYIPILFLFLIGCSDSNFMLSPVDEIIETPDEPISQTFWFDETQDWNKMKMVITT